MKDFFQRVTIANSLKSIRSVFQLGDKQGHKLVYDPPYQRNYVWTDVKGSYLIESILLHGEIPPVVIYIRDITWEVIDGRQRCETILRFLNDGFALKSQGLDKLWNLSGKKFSQLDEKLKERIQNTYLRFTIIRAKDEDGITAQAEEWIKREIFKRYNFGISPLKKEEVSKAQYLQDEINNHFKNIFYLDNSLYEQTKKIFDHRKKNLESIMQHIRQLLVLQNIPINRYVIERDDIINKYYDYLSYQTVNSGRHEDIQLIFGKFRQKLDFLLEIKTLLSNGGTTTGGMTYDCLYWAIAVCEKEKIMYEKINNEVFKKRLVRHIQKNIQEYAFDGSAYFLHLAKSYALMASFFNSQLDISFAGYLKSDQDFLVRHRDLMIQYMKERFQPGQEDEYFSKALPTSNTVSDILDKMERGKFCLRPAYQRDEVMDKKKASFLIESILLGLKIPPIYIYLREDGVFEVIDGQQRLLAIIGFLGKMYMNEHGQMSFSKKNEFSLLLPTALMSELHGKKFSDLPDSMKRCILNLDIDIIEIKQKDNGRFKPEELFKRLNSKPFPIKEHTFEYWNAYIDGTIIESIKETFKRNSWLYLRKHDIRMLNEELVTWLGYFHYMSGGDSPAMEVLRKTVAIYKFRDYISIRIRNRAYLSHILENHAFKEEFLLSFREFELDFIEKVKLLVSSPTGKNGASVINNRLDKLLHIGAVRVFLNFSLLWLVLKGIPIEYVESQRSVVLKKINKIFLLLRTAESVQQLEDEIESAWALARKSRGNMG